MPKISLIDYGQGNIGSVDHFFSRLGEDVEIFARPDKVTSDSVILLPGVGSFDSGVRRLVATGWFDFLQAWSLGGNRLIGICLGMQLMTQGSEEGKLDGLGIFPGGCELNDAVAHPGIRVPNVGWRQLHAVPGSLGTKLVPANNRFYFSHSYNYASNDSSYTIANVIYGNTMPAVIMRRRTVGIQFHPEKSHHYGAVLIRNTLALLNG